MYGVASAMFRNEGNTSNIRWRHAAECEVHFVRKHLRMASAYLTFSQETFSAAEPKAPLSSAVVGDSEQQTYGIDRKLPNLPCFRTTLAMCIEYLAGAILTFNLHLHAFSDSIPLLAPAYFGSEIPPPQEEKMFWTRMVRESPRMQFSNHVSSANAPFSATIFHRDLQERLLLCPIPKFFDHHFRLVVVAKGATKVHGCLYLTRSLGKDTTVSPTGAKPPKTEQARFDPCVSTFALYHSFHTRPERILWPLKRKRCCIASHN